MSATKETEQDRYLVISEERDSGYYHLRGRITTQRFEDRQFVPYGLSDDYGVGVLWTGLQVSCQGDRDSQRRTPDREVVYGFDCEYRDVFGIDLNKARRMCKTLELLNRKLEKLKAARGYVKSYGEYLRTDRGSGGLQGDRHSYAGQGPSRL